jgi:ATP-dependent helicase/nuclease subunit A
VLSTQEARPSDAILRGLITHKLLESLPGLPPESRRLAASRYVDKAAANWTDVRRAAVVADVLQVLEDVRFQYAFAAGSRAEVSVMGHVKVRGETRMVSGKIDRISVEDNRVLLVDFKTDYAMAHSAADVPASYLTQMALYRAILQPLYPGKAVECALLYTGGARLIDLPPERMDAALEALANS